MNPSQQALERIMEEHKEALFSFAFFRVGSFAVAQDMVQDAFVQLYDHPKFTHVDNPKAYLMRTIANRCVDYLRGRKEHLPLDRLVETAPPEERAYVEQFVQIETLLGELPPEQAQVIRLVCVDELSFVQAAELLDISVNTAKSRYRYGIAKLRQSPKITCYES